MTLWEPPLVAVTRDERSDDSLSRALQAKGARVLPLATIRIAAPDDMAPLEMALASLPTYDWIVFTSANAVDAACGHPLWERAWGLGSVRARIAAVGAATARRLSARGVPVHLVPPRAGGQGLAVAMAAGGSIQQARVLWPRSDIARPELAVELAFNGAIIVDPPAYRTVTVIPDRLQEFLDALESRRVDAVAFLSPSSARGLARALPGGTLQPLSRRTIVASIGPTTTAAVAELGLRVDLEPAEPNAVALASAIMQRCAA